MERLEFKEIAWYRGRKFSCVPCFPIAGGSEWLEFKKDAWYRGRKCSAVPCFLPERGNVATSHLHLQVEFAILFL